MNPQEAGHQVESIQQRNARVEADKAWEISWTRRGIITIGTYIIIGGYLMVLGIKDAWLHALVPVMAYILSTISLPALKQIWMRYIYTRES